MQRAESWTEGSGPTAPDAAQEQTRTKQINGKVTAFAGRAWQAGIASPRRKGKLAAQAGKQKIAIRDSH